MLEPTRTERSLATSLQGKQGVQGVSALGTVYTLTTRLLHGIDCLTV